MKDNLERRDFLKQAAIVTASAAVASGAADQSISDNKKVDKPEKIPTKLLGKIGVKLPILGFGGAALPTAWGNPLSYEDRIKLVQYAYDQGIRFYDTAGNYMESQQIIGQALKLVRKKCFLATKVETTEPTQVRKAVEKALKELQTDYIDLIQIHGTPGIEQMTVTQAMKIHAELIKLRDENIVKHIGFSAHSYFDKALKLIDTGGFEQCMLSYGYIPRGHDQLWSAGMLELRNACIAKAHELGMGIVAMKVIGAGVLGAWSGHVVPEFQKPKLAKLPAAAMRYVMQDERIDLMAIGMRLKTEIDANIKILKSDTEYTLDDRALLAQYSAKALDSKTMKAMRVD